MKSTKPLQTPRSRDCAELPEVMSNLLRRAIPSARPVPVVGVVATPPLFPQLWTRICCLIDVADGSVLFFRSWIAANG